MKIKNKSKNKSEKKSDAKMTNSTNQLKNEKITDELKNDRESVNYQSLGFYSGKPQVTKQPRQDPEDI